MSPINHFILVIKKMLRQDIEWARDGDDGKLYIVQARPETVASQKKVGVIEEYKMLEKGTLDDLEYGKQLELEFSTKKDEWMGYVIALQQIYRYTYTEVVALFFFLGWSNSQVRSSRWKISENLYREMHITYEAYGFTCVQLCTVLYYVLFVQFSVLLIV